LEDPSNAAGAGLVPVPDDQPAAPHWLARLRAWVSGFMFGAAMSWVMAPHTLKHRRDMERIFMLVTAGELMGWPLAPPLTGLRLLPFAVPQILTWRRMLLLWDDQLESVDLRHIGH
jgi:HAMP domain-containing protein